MLTQAQAPREKFIFLAKAATQTRLPMPVLVLQQDQVESILLEKYSGAHEKCDRCYAMTTLITTSGQLEIEGILDTGAGAILLGIFWPAAC